ncbi:MAG: hypothetical protein ACRENG_37095, partial [bacterium]
MVRAEKAGAAAKQCDQQVFVGPDGRWSKRKIGFNEYGKICGIRARPGIKKLEVVAIVIKYHLRY